MSSYTEIRDRAAAVINPETIRAFFSVIETITYYT